MPLFIRQNVHKMEQYLSDNCSINITGCYIISISKMYIMFCKVSSSSIQIQKINFVMQHLVFVDLNIQKDYASPL